MSWVDDLFASFERYDRPDESTPPTDESDSGSGGWERADHGRQSGSLNGAYGSPDPYASEWPDESRHTWPSPAGGGSDVEAGWRPNLNDQAWSDYLRPLVAGEWPDESARAIQRPFYRDPGTIELPRRGASEFGMPQPGGNGGDDRETGWLRNRLEPAPRSLPSIDLGVSLQALRAYKALQARDLSERANGALESSTRRPLSLPPLIDPGLQACYEWGVEQGLVPPPSARTCTVVLKPPWLRSSASLVGSPFRLLPHVGGRG